MAIGQILQNAPQPLLREYPGIANVGKLMVPKGLILKLVKLLLQIVMIYVPKEEVVICVPKANFQIRPARVAKIVPRVGCMRVPYEIIATGCAHRGFRRAIIQTPASRMSGMIFASSV